MIESLVKDISREDRLYIVTNDQLKNPTAWGKVAEYNEQLRKMLGIANWDAMKDTADIDMTTGKVYLT